MTCETARMATVEIIDATIELRPLLTQLFELYQYDFSEWSGGDVDDDGRYGEDRLPLYWVESARHPFLFRVDGHWAGLALVREGVPHDMAEFFVMRKYRRGGVGTEAARGVFARFPGEWQVRQMRLNPQATVFWRRAIPVAFDDDENDDGPLQRFTIG
jgi:predicted acetyltransferase